MKKVLALLLIVGLVLPSVCLAERYYLENHEETVAPFDYTRCLYHPDANLIYHKGVYVEPKDSAEHYYYPFSYYSCTVCGESMMEMGDEQTRPHTFNGSECIDCHYRKSSSPTSQQKKTTGNQHKGGNSSTSTGQGNPSANNDWWNNQNNTSGRWPTVNITGVRTSLNSLQSNDMRHQSFFGPGKNYPGAGAYKPHQAVSVTALFKEGNFVFVDMTYTTVGRRCLFFPAYTLSNSNVQELDLSSPSFGVTNQDCQPMFGPGYEYNGVVQKRQNGGASDIILPAGTEIQVFFEANKWVYAQFSCVLGTIRGWLPENIVNRGY